MWTLVGGMQSRRQDRVSNDHRRAQAKLARALISRDEVLLTNIEALWPLVIRFSMHDKISQYGSMHPVIGASSSTPSPNETIRYMSREFPLFGSVCSIMRMLCNARMRMYAPQRMQQYVYGCALIHSYALECNLGKKLHVFG